MHDITCIIPTFNDPVRTRRAVASALSQTGVEVRVLLVDDVSQPDALDDLQRLADSDPRIDLHRMPRNEGQSVARNVGAILAQSSYICFLDQDDQHAPGWYQTGINYLQANPHYGVISGAASFIDIPERLQVDEFDLRLKGLSFVFVTNSIFRRTVFLASGGFPVGPAWRGPHAGEDGVLRTAFFEAFHSIHAFVPALIHTVREGGATTYFLDHTRVENDQVVFLDPADDSLGPAYIQYLQRFDENVRYLKATLLQPPPVVNHGLSAVQKAPDHAGHSDAQEAPSESEDWTHTQGASNADKAERVNAALGLYRNFQEVEPLCIKHTSYFQVYEKVLRPYVGKPITFVEVGVFNGGSLAMWREYLGPQARIIGVDLNPQARHWENLGFEIFVGDQADRAFWRAFYSQVGPVDVLLDDGGHMNHQQIVTLQESLPHLRDGGSLIIEDVHASYLPEFGNPSEASFIQHAKSLVDDVNARYPGLPVGYLPYRERVWSVSFYESMVVLHIDSRRCFESQPISNQGTAETNVDYRHAGLSPEDV